MIYDHVVKRGGIYYSAGTEVPEASVKVVEVESVPVSVEDKEVITEAKDVAKKPNRGRPKKNA